jgi:hypothetical protein
MCTIGYPVLLFVCLVDLLCILNVWVTWCTMCTVGYPVLLFVCLVDLLCILNVCTKQVIETGSMLFSQDMILEIEFNL